MQMVLAIAAGGALGALLRHYVNNAVVHVFGMSFPWGIFAINIAGSFMMGLLVGIFAHYGEVPQNFKAFLTVGILGAFTTFSTFSLDTIVLLERGALLSAALYVAGSVFFAITSLYGGMLLMRAFTA
jgi:fluoride exporter